MEFYNHYKIQRTRKNHTCFLCRLQIPATYPCQYDYGKFDGEFFSRHSHNECFEECKAQNREADSDEWWELDECLNNLEDGGFEKWRCMIREKYNL